MTVLKHLIKKCQWLVNDRFHRDPAVMCTFRNCHWPVNDNSEAVCLKVTLTGQWQFSKIYFSIEAWRHPHFRASHWLRAQNWAFSLVPGPVYDKSKGVLFHFFSTSELSLTGQWQLRIRGGESQKKCHWLVNDSFGSYYNPGIAENWKVSLISQRQFWIVLQHRNCRKIEKCHWLVNDSFRSYNSPGIAENRKVSLSGQWQFWII